MKVQGKFRNLLSFYAQRRLIHVQGLMKLRLDRLLQKNDLATSALWCKSSDSHTKVTYSQQPSSSNVPCFEAALKAFAGWLPKVTCSRRVSSSWKL